MSSFFGRYRHWLVPLGKLGSGKALATLIAGVFGLLIVPNVDPKVFALYTLFASLQQTIASFTDMGIVGSVISVGAKYRHDAGLFAHLMHTIKVYRERLFGFSFLLGVILSSQIFTKHDASFGMIGIALALTISTAWVIIHNQMIGGVLWLEERFNAVSFVTPTSGAIKLLLLFFCLAFNQAGLIALLLINLIAEAITHLQYRRHYRMPKPPVNDEENAKLVRKHVNDYIKPMIAGSILLYIQAPLILWVLNGMGNVGEVAKYGAISRLGQVTNFVSYICTALVLTRIAKTESRAATQKLLAKLTIIQVVAVVSVIGGAVILTKPLLHLLGKNYSHAHAEFHLFLISWGLWHMAAFFFQALTGQGISKFQGHLNTIAIAVQVACVFAVGVSSARHAFAMNIVYSATMMAGQLVLIYLFVVRKPAGDAEILPEPEQT
ncbi:hypothetical protein IT570_09095 [Candidatus Sumerlaeota bacterium]|nr:hypothetical protein [Candidatus Sumerlaeota bacterium]